MKKIIFTVAAVATMLASCSTNEVDDVVNRNGKTVIDFTNLNDKVSRAANDGNNDYKVYAKLSAADQTSWFIDDVLGGTTNTSTSGKIHYWPSEGGVDFYAWAPATDAAIVATATCPTISIAYTVPAAANQDFTVATPVKNQNKSTDEVAFQFSHMLSKISVSATLTQALTTAGYTINFTSSELKVACSGATIDPTADAADWTSLNTTAATYKIEKDKSCMIMPQPSVGCTVQLQGVTISKGGAEVFSGDLKVHTIAANALISGDKFAKGSHYNLQFTIDTNAHDNGNGSGGNEKPVFGDAIQFSATLAPWTDVTPSLPQP